MDEVDLTILNLLKKDAKMPIKEIAACVGLSISPTYERIRKLEQNGAIKGYVAVLDERRLGKDLAVFVHISLNEHTQERIERFRTAVLALPEVETCNHVSGTYDFLLKVLVTDVAAYRSFVVEQLATIDGISNVQSSFSLDQIK